MKQWNSRKWLAAFALIAVTALEGHAAQRLPATGEPGPCAKVGVARVGSLSQAAEVIVCSVSDRSLLVVGELHGGNETPDLVASLVKDALATRTVRLGLEMQRSEQPSLDAYLHSEGSSADKAALLQNAFWIHQDGRSSTAVLRLIDTVRGLRAHGARVDIFAMEPDYGDEAAIASAGGPQKFKERGMALAIRHTMEQGDSGQLVIALMGNFHPRYDPENPSPAALGPSVVEQLASQRPYVVFPFARSTDMWNCQQDGCGVHSFTTTHAPKGTLPQFVIDVARPEGPTMVKLWLPRMTAALPARDDLAKHPG